MNDINSFKIGDKVKILNIIGIISRITLDFVGIIYINSIGEIKEILVKPELLEKINEK